MTKVLLIASGFSARLVHEYDYKANGWKIVAVNNGWQSCNYWDYWVRSSDFKGQRPGTVTLPQIEVKRYGPQLNKFGGQKECGYSITLNAGYWALAELKPTVMGFLGADMNYTPDENGHTHIYGLGYDIQKNSIPDPDRMVNLYGKDDPDYLNTIYNRLYTTAEKNGCRIYNLSNDPNTRLPYPKEEPQNL